MKSKMTNRRLRVRTQVQAGAGGGCIPSGQGWLCRDAQDNNQQMCYHESCIEDYHRKQGIPYQRGGFRFKGSSEA